MRRMALLFCLLGAAGLARSAPAYDPRPFEQWFRVVSPGDLQGEPVGFRWIRVWNQDGRWLSANRFFIYQKILFSAVHIDIQEKVELDAGGILAFVQDSYVRVPVRGARRDVARGRRVAEGMAVSAGREDRGDPETRIFPAGEYDEIFALDQRFIPRRRDLAPGQARQMRFLKPLLLEVETVPVTALREDTWRNQKAVLMEHRFDKNTWTYWRNADNRVIRLDHERGVWLPDTRESVLESLNPEILDAAGQTERSLELPSAPPPGHPAGGSTPGS